MNPDKYKIELWEPVDIKERKLYLDIQEIGADMKKNQDYYLDLNDWTVKKH